MAGGGGGFRAGSRKRLGALRDRVGPEPLGRSSLLVAAGFGVAAAIRIAYLVRFAGNYDVAAFADAADILRRGGDLYLETARYNYSPVFAYTLLGLSRLGDALGVSLAHLLGALLLAADAATAVLVSRMAGGGRRGAAAALIFFANPVSVFVSSFHLQFDGLAILALLAAVHAAERRPGSGRIPLWLSVSLLVKHIAAFFPPLFLRSRRRGGIGLAAAAVPYALFAASFLPFWRQWSGIRSHVLEYRSLAEDYGVGMLRNFAGLPRWLPTAVFLAAVLAALVLLRGVPLRRSCLLLFLVALIFAPGICEYYFVWPVALGALTGGAGYLIYTVTVSAFFLGSPDGLNLPLHHLPGWHGIWWSLVLWLALELRALRRPAGAAEDAT